MSLEQHRGPLPDSLLDVIFDQLAHRDLRSCLTVSSFVYILALPKLFKTLRISDNLEYLRYNDQDVQGKFGCHDGPRPRFRRDWLKKTRLIEVYTHLNVTFKHDYKFTKDHFVPINMPSLETIRIHVEPPTSESRYKNPADYRKLPFALIQHLRPSTVVLRSENAIHQAILPPIQDLLKEAHTFTLVSGAAVNRVWNFFTTFNLPPAVKTFSIVILTNKACLYGNIRGLNKTYSSWHWNEESAKVSHLDRALNAIMRKASGTKHEDFKINWVHFDKPAPLNLILAFNHEITIPTTRGPLLQEMDTVFTNMGAMPYGFGTAGPKVPKLCPVQFIDTTQFISTEDWNAAFDEDEIEPWFHPSWTQQERNWRANRAPVWGGIDWLCERTFGQYELTEQEKLSNDEMIAETEKIFDNVTDEQRDIFGRRKRAKVE